MLAVWNRQADLNPFLNSSGLDTWFLLMQHGRFFPVLEISGRTRLKTRRSTPFEYSVLRHPFLSASVDKQPPTY